MTNHDMTRVTGLYGRKASDGTINWFTVSTMVVDHVLCAAALFYIETGAILAMLAMWFVSGSLGIGMGYHRLLTHRGYKTPKWVEYALTILGTLALQGGPIFWVAAHRIHHRYADKEGDPHSPREGTYWAHIGWIFAITTIHHDPAVLRRYVPDLIKDRFHVALSTWNWVPQVVVALAFYAFGGVPYVLWAVFFRTTFGLHATSLVNSATHLWGSRRFMTGDDSTNNWWVSLLTFGEGWHNNHHADPVSMRHGLTWYEIDVNYYGIKTLELFGLAWDLKAASLPIQAQGVTQASPDAVDLAAAEPALTDERGAVMGR